MRLRKQKTLIEKAQEAAEQVRPQVEAAYDQAIVYAQEGMKQATPLIEQGKVKAGVTLAHVAGLAADAAENAQHFVEDKTADLQHDEPKSKRGKLKKLLLVGVVLAVVGVVVKKLSDKKEAARWQDTAPRPTPPPTPVSSPPKVSSPTPAAATEKPTDDSAGASPGEALADAADTPHAVTTPDAPADVVDVDETTTGTNDDGFKA